MGKPRFRRTVVAVAILHGLVIGFLFYWSTREVRVQQAKVTWLNTSDFLPPEPEEEIGPKKFEPLPETEPVPASELSSNPSEIALPTPTPTPTPAPTPTPTPKATPKPTRKPTAKPTPKPSPKPSPKASPKPSPKSSPKSSPKPSPKASPKKTESAEEKSETSAPKAEAVGTKTGGSAGASSGSASGSATGAAGGSGDSLVGAFHDHIHDRFFSVWDQPTSIAGTANFVTGLRIKIESDGRISDFKVVRSSGNVVMDESVMAAARRVLKVNTPPAGLLSGGAYQVTINFELE